MDRIMPPVTGEEKGRHSQERTGAASDAKLARTKSPAGRARERLPRQGKGHGQERQRRMLAIASARMTLAADPFSAECREPANPSAARKTRR